MLHFLDPLRDITIASVLFRMLLSFACGLAAGLERSSKNRSAGIRTHILVCLGATMASLSGHFIYLVLQLPADMTRIGAQVVAGLGFIGAGTIIVTQKEAIKGLTTAAGLWTSGIAGLAIGSGFYEGGILTTAIILIVEIVLFRFVHGLRRTPPFKVIVQYGRKDALDQILRICNDMELAVMGLRLTGTEGEGDDEAVFTADISLRSAGLVDEDTLLAKLRDIQGAKSVELQEITK